MNKMGNTHSSSKTESQRPWHHFSNWNFQTESLHNRVLKTQRGSATDRRNPLSTSSYVPKILSGVNPHNILAGEESYDNFLHTCRLDTELLRFGMPFWDWDTPLSLSDEHILGQDGYVSEVEEAMSMSRFPPESQPSSFFISRMDETLTCDAGRSRLYSEEHNEALPPPYSELPDQSITPEDPPPSYLESFFHKSGGQQGEHVTSRTDTSDSFYFCLY